MTKYGCVWVGNGNAFARGFDTAEAAERYGRLAAGATPFTVELLTYRQFV